MEIKIKQKYFIYLILFLIPLLSFTVFAQDQKIMSSCTNVDANKYDCFFDSTSRQYLLSFCDGNNFNSLGDSFATKNECVQSCASTKKCLSTPSETAATNTVVNVSLSTGPSCSEICSQNYAFSSLSSLKTIQDAQCSSSEPYSSSKYFATGVSYTWATFASPGTCQSGQCWCLISAKVVNTSQQDITSLIPASGLGTSSFPGTSGTIGWYDPSTVERPPAKKPNYHLCDIVSNVSITGNIPNLLEADTKVTITGEVTKFSNTCDGIAYQCRPQTKVGCTTDSGLFETCIETKACPTNYPNKIHEEGTGCDTNWGLILGLVGMFTGTNNLMMLGLLLQSTSSQDESACFGICAKDYWTNEQDACVAQPTCNGPVVDTRSCKYNCKEISCGPFEGRTVDIQIKAKDGSVAQSYQAATDVNGQFSYTFTTPKKDGPYAVVASVVKDWTNSTNSIK